MENKTHKNLHPVTY